MKISESALVDCENTLGIICKSAGFRNSLALAMAVANSTANILITGESGTGKEVIANAIHKLGNHNKGPFVAINCSSIPENLVESELFGHSKGAFTGAIERRIGLFEEAEGGTIFLDEIGDLNLALQAKLLRVLQQRQIKRIGENNYRKINVRVLSATHKDLQNAISEGRFREDLFYRLNVIPIYVPPLRQRKDDIIPLAEFFLTKFLAMNESKPKKYSHDAINWLMEYTWKGNVRELENAVERAAVLSTGEIIESSDLRLIQNIHTQNLDESIGFKKITENRILTFSELTKKYFLYVLNLNNGAKEKTAKDLNIDRKTLYRRLNELKNSDI